MNSYHEDDRNKSCLKQKAKRQPICECAKVDCVGSFNGREGLPRCVKEKKVFHIVNVRSCVIFKSEGLSLQPVSEEFKNNF